MISRTYLRTRTKLLGGVAATALVLAACGGDGDVAEPAATAPPATAAAAPSPTDEMADDEMADDEMADDEMADDEMADDEMADDEMADDEMADDEMADDEMADDEMADDEMADDEMADDEMADDDMSDDDMSMADVVAFNVTISTSADAEVATPLAPGVWVVNAGVPTLFEDGAADAGDGLEALAEDGDPAALADWAASSDAVFHTGVFNTPDGADEPGPALPGGAYTFEIQAVPGDSLNFATMFVQSNDWFVAPASDTGIVLFDADGNPISGDITAEVAVWDAGTEADQPLGSGVDQAPRQAGPNTGADEGGVVRTVADGAGTVTVSITPVG